MFTDAELVAAYPQIRKFAMRLASDRAQADDLAQETVCRMLKNRARYEQTGRGLVSWGFKIAQNAFYDSNSMARNRPETTAERLYDPVPGSQEPRHELGDSLAFLSQINGRGEALLLLALGDSHEEIAIKQGLEVGTVKSRINRARGELDAHFGIERHKRRSGNRKAAK